MTTTADSETKTDLLLLHPTGSEDPGQVSLAVGLLEWIRQGFERRHLHAILWTETAVDSDGRRRFVLRPTPWRAKEVTRKLELVPTAEATLMLNLAETPAHVANLSIADRRGDPLAEVALPFDEDGIYKSFPAALNELLSAFDRDPYTASASELFQTEDSTMALASLYALERVVAFQAGIGRDDPSRLMEPALACLKRDAANPLARDCLLRLGQSLLETQQEPNRKAAVAAFERWSDLAPISPLPPFYLAIAHDRTGEHEPARGAFEEALKRDPLFCPAIQEYALWLGNRGFTDQGVAVLRNAIGRTQLDGALMDQAGCLLANAGRLNEAEPLFRASIMAGGPQTAYTNLARGLFAGGKEEEAIDTLNAGLTTDPDRTQVELLGEIARGQGLAASKARALLRGMTTEGNGDEAVLKELTSALMELEGAESAMPHARRLLKETTNTELRNFAFYVLLKARLPEIDEQWDETVENAVSKDAAAAETYLRKVIELEPNFGRAHFLLALSLERQGRSSEALFHVESAAASGESDDPNVLDLLGRTRGAAGNAAGAAQAHHRAASLAPQNPRILHNAAVSLLRANYFHEGTGLAAASLSIEPDQPDLRELLEKATKKLAAPKRGVVAKVRRWLRV